MLVSAALLISQKTDAARTSVAAVKLELKVHLGSAQSIITSPVLSHQARITRKNVNPYCVNFFPYQAGAVRTEAGNTWDCDGIA